MTDIAQEFAYDTAAVHAATDRLLVSVAKLDDEAVGEPSLLPGWTRGHVLAHLARNADALVNLLTWARTGTRTPMYASPGVRDADIERDAARPLAAHVEDLRSSAERWEAACADLGPERLSYEVEMRNGVTERAGRLPFRRLAEVELHHVDLGVGYTVDHLATEYVDAELAFLAERRLKDNGQVAALELRTDDGRSWRTGRADGTPLTVTGAPTALVGWLTGRTAGTGLTTADGAALPELPDR
ncbi:mycothiol maleylpyruvate isomerase [Streptomyces sp. Ru73]|uniref:maleylpyruvate isomerase family mycothiol-dependent enzyme n=1 Tax=Streptomyces sp. Ru73 TaxID=2080748 RepID=UPI000CDDEF5C|nr:maleylpyruvate isomerase family mycothiol-dependent enzyme [Streptomyces sp. Ru73]POX36860.1 mycothiol maleylpyruvate isomerase [Streptomyces sp. Ru73]